MKKPTLAVLLTVAALIVASLFETTKGQPANAPNPFRGARVVLVQAAGEDGLFAMENVRSESINGRSFLVGTGFAIEGEEDWQAGVELFVAFDTVTAVFKMKDLTQYRRFLEITSN